MSHVPTPSQLRAAIVSYLDRHGPLTSAMIAFGVDADHGAVKSALKVLVDEGSVARRDRASDPPIFSSCNGRQAWAHKAAAENSAYVQRHRRSS